MRGILTPSKKEAASLYTQGLGEPDRLGERETTYTPQGEHSVGVQPLGAEQKEAAGLTGDAETLRVQFAPPVPVTPGDKLELRDREWSVVRAENWESYSAVIVEPM